MSLASQKASQPVPRRIDQIDAAATTVALEGDQPPVGRPVGREVRGFERHLFAGLIRLPQTEAARVEHDEPKQEAQRSNDPETHTPATPDPLDDVVRHLSLLADAVPAPPETHRGIRAFGG